jgi:hypothetical protein
VNENVGSKRINSRLPASKGVSISIATTGAVGAQMPHRMDVAQDFSPPTSVVAGDNILNEGVLSFHLLNQYAEIVPGDGTFKGFLVPFLDSGCSSRATGTQSGHWQVDVISGKGIFWNASYHKAETIYLGICASLECDSNKLAESKICLERPVTITPAGPSQIRLVTIVPSTT